MAKSPSKEDRERLAAAIEVLWVGGNSDKLLDLIGIPEPERSELRREGGLKERARAACAEILYDAIVSAHDRIDELEEGGVISEAVPVKLTIKQMSEWQRVRDHIRINSAYKAQDKEEYDALDAESLDMMRKMHDFGFSNNYEREDYERLQTLRRLGYIRHCYSIAHNFYFWILTEKGYAYLRKFDRNSLT